MMQMQINSIEVAEINKHIQNILNNKSIDKHTHTQRKRHTFTQQQKHSIHKHN